MEYPGPGNVRELKSTLEYAFVVAESGLIRRSTFLPRCCRSKGAVRDKRQPAQRRNET